MAARLYSHARTYWYRRHKSDRQCRTVSKVTTIGLRNLTWKVTGSGPSGPSADGPSGHASGRGAIPAAALADQLDRRRGRGQESGLYRDGARPIKPVSAETIARIAAFKVVPPTI